MHNRTTTTATNETTTGHDDHDYLIIATTRTAAMLEAVSSPQNFKPTFPTSFEDLIIQFYWCWGFFTL